LLQLPVGRKNLPAKPAAPGGQVLLYKSAESHKWISPNSNSPKKPPLAGYRPGWHIVAECPDFWHEKRFLSPDGMKKQAIRPD
jgi:hypothetical protein